MRVTIAVCALLIAAVLTAGGATAARSPTPGQKAAITAALRSEQGDVAVEAITVSTVNPDYASMDWGFSNGGLAANNNSILVLASGRWKVLWTRESEAPVVGACVYVPAPVAHDLLHVSCPAPRSLRARTATVAELALLRKGFLASPLTPYATTSTGLRRACISNASPVWAAAVGGFPSGSSAYIWFKHTISWRPAFESLLQRGSPPPPAVVLSLASCVGYNPADFGA